MKYAIYKRFGGFGVTSLDNYHAGIIYGSKVMEFKHENGFELMSDVIDYMVKYCHAKVDDFVVK